MVAPAADAACGQAAALGGFEACCKELLFGSSGVVGGAVEACALQWRGS